MKNKKKLVILTATVIVVIGVAAAGIVYGIKNKSGSVVDVYSMDLLNSSGWFDDSSQLSGTITSDYVQEVYPNESNDVEKVYVKEGDTVKEGDKLIKYNVEEEELDLQLQDLQIQSSKMEIEKMEKELQKLKNTKATGAVDGSGSTLMNASLNLSSFKGNTLASLMAAADASTSDKAAADASDKAADNSTSDKAAAETAEGSKDEKKSSEDKTGTEEQTAASTQTAENTTESTTKNISEEYAASKGKRKAKVKANAVKTDLHTSITDIESQKAYGEGTEESPYVFYLIKDGENRGVIKGSVLNALIKEKRAETKYVRFNEYASKEEFDKGENNILAQLLITPDNYMDSADSDKMYALEEAKGIIKERTLKKDLKDSVENVASDAYSGTGSSDNPYIYLLRRGGTVKGSVVKNLLDNGKYAEFRVFESEMKYESSGGQAEETYTFTPVYGSDGIEDAKGYSLTELKELIANKKLKKKITSVSDKFSGDGSANSPYIYLLCTDGTVKGSVIQELVKGEYTASFRAFKNEASYEADADNPKEQVEVFSGMPISGIQPDTEYTLTALKDALKKAEEASKLPNILKAEITDKKNDAFSGSGKHNEHYQYRLSSNGRIRGSVINDLLKSNEYGDFFEYSSEEDGRNEKPSNSISIRPGTLFKESITSFAWYTIADLNDALVTADKIQIKPAKKSVQAGKTYKFTAKLTGKNNEVLTVSWELKRNKSTQTTLVNGVLTVASDEPSDSLRIIASAGGKKAVLNLKVKGAKNSTPSDASDNTGGDGNSGGSGGDISDSYTADELRDAISDKEDEIAEAKQDLNEAKINYKEAKKEVDAATVKAKVSGKVTVAYTADAMPTDGSPAIVVRADDGMYVDVSIDEMALDTVKVGGTILCTSMESGEEYEAVVKDVSEFPVSSSASYDGMANPNSSYYPVVAYIEDAEGLNVGESVSVSYNAQSMGTSSEDAIYLQKAYVRTDDTDNKQSYVYKEGKNGRLEKQYVKTGKTVYGQYVEIVSGVTLEDNIAFPYGKNVKEGAKVKLSENEDNIIY